MEESYRLSGPLFSELIGVPGQHRMLKGVPNVDTLERSVHIREDRRQEHQHHGQTYQECLRSVGSLRRVTQS
jgi:hypothetical protein